MTKKIIFTLIALISFLHCKAQIPGFMGKKNTVTISSDLFISNNVNIGTGVRYGRTISKVIQASIHYSKTGLNNFKSDLYDYKGNQYLFSFDFFLEGTPSPVGSKIMIGLGFQNQKINTDHFFLEQTNTNKNNKIIYGGSSHTKVIFIGYELGRFLSRNQPIYISTGFKALMYMGTPKEKSNHISNQELLEENRSSEVFSYTLGIGYIF
jgi:hypothetical protein